MDKLITEYNRQVPFTVKLLDYYEIHIMPVLNPDGYDYTFTVKD
jgi:murein tripeptide amidase MpaA